MFICYTKLKHHFRRVKEGKQEALCCDAECHLNIYTIANLNYDDDDDQICGIEEYIAIFDMMNYFGQNLHFSPPVSLFQGEHARAKMQVDRYVCLLQGGAIAPLWKVHTRG